MKKSTIIVNLLAAGSSLFLACTSEKSNDGGMGGAAQTSSNETSESTTNSTSTTNGDTDTDTSQGGSLGHGSGGADAGGGTGPGGDNGVGELDSCSDEISASAVGGAGGAMAASCEVPEPPLSHISIAGSYVDDFGGAYTISDTLWDAGWAKFHLSLTNNDSHYALGLNAESNSYFPCEWSRFAWTKTQDSLYYCQSPYSGESECAAENADLPDAEDLEHGCNGFAWSKLLAAK